MIYRFGKHVVVLGVFLLANCLSGLLAINAIADWQQPVDMPLNTADLDGGGPSIAVVGGKPTVVWSESESRWTSDGQISISSYDGSGWQTLGKSASGRRCLLNWDCSQVAVDAKVADVGGDPYVAWSEWSKRFPAHLEVRVARLSGGTWQYVGDKPVEGDGVESAEQPSIANIDGIPYVAWRDGDAGDLKVARWSGSSWEQVGSEVVKGSYALQPDLVSADGTPAVIWREKNYWTDPGQIKAAQYSERKWSSLGGSASLNLSTSQDADSPGITAVGKKLYAVWTEPNSKAIRQVVSKSFDLSASTGTWVRAGDQINRDADLNAQETSIATIDGYPEIAWSEESSLGDELRVAYFDEDLSQWARIYDHERSINPADHDSGLVPSITAMGDAPILAWRDDYIHHDIRVSEYVRTPELGAEQQIKPGGDPVTLTGLPSHGKDGHSYMWLKQCESGPAAFPVPQFKMISHINLEYGGNWLQIPKSELANFPDLTVTNCISDYTIKMHIVPEGNADGVALLRSISLTMPVKIEARAYSHGLQVANCVYGSDDDPINIDFTTAIKSGQFKGKMPNYEDDYMVISANKFALGRPGFVGCPYGPFATPGDLGIRLVQNLDPNPFRF